MNLLHPKFLRLGRGIRRPGTPSARQERKVRSSFRAWVSRCVLAAPVFMLAYCSNTPTSPQASMAGEDHGGLASALDDGNTIHACKKNQSGTIRLVDSADQCLPSETLVEWGVQGPAGPPGVVDAHVHLASINSDEEGSDDAATATAFCETGEIALGGGYVASGFAVEVGDDRPVEMGGLALDDGDTPGGWLVSVRNPSGDSFTLSVWVICAPTGVEA